MRSLADAQANFIDTINNGPDWLDPLLFAGSAERVLLGLKAHANTVSHARLVALEATFPLTRQHLGDAAFNEVARDFVETDIARASDINRIGACFPDCLSDVVARELALIEWAWLESYNALDAAPLMLSDMAQLTEAALLDMCVAPHPSARLVPISSPIAAPLMELHGERPEAILCVRPATDVRVIPLNFAQLAVFGALIAKNVTIGNLLAIAVEQVGELASLEPILPLIGAGALVKAG